MKVALSHDYLNQLGGGERILSQLIKIFPQAPVYTLLYDKEKTRDLYEGKIKGTSFLDFKFCRDHHRIFIPFMPLAIRSINLKDDFDLVISDTAGFAKGIKYGKKTKHIVYCHTPLRYAWETKTYFNRGLRSWLIRFFGFMAFRYLRYFDKKSAKKADLLIANSKHIQKKIKRYFNLESKVIYPCIRDSVFYYDKKIKPQEYFLTVGRFLHYKRFDLVIEAFNKLGYKLKIVGTGNIEDNLKNLIKSKNIEILPFVNDDNELRKIYAGAKAFIIPNAEDFGLVTAEAQACGTPVIGLDDGGTPEIVEHKKTGILFGEQTIDSLIKGVEELREMNFDRQYIAGTASRFSEKTFTFEFLKAVNEVMG